MIHINKKEVATDAVQSGVPFAFMMHLRESYPQRIEDPHADEKKYSWNEMNQYARTVAVNSVKFLKNNK